MQDKLSDNTMKLIDLKRVKDLTSLGTTKIYEYVKAGELKIIKIGKKTVFLESEIFDWINKQVRLRDEKKLNSL